LPAPIVIAFIRRHLSPLLALGLLIGCFAPQEQGSPTEPVHAGLEGQMAVEQGESEAESSALPSPTNPLGMWVLAEGSQRVLDDPARVAPMIETALALGVTDLFVQVYRGGRAWYDATLADPAPYQASLEAGGGVDALALLIASAHENGLRVHAWVNVLTLSRKRRAPILDALGDGAVLVDRRGRSVLDYPDLEVPAPDSDFYRMGTRGVYLDAGSPGVREWLTDTFRELVARYPELDGLHLDYIRHPGALPFVPGSRFGVGLDFGYGAATRARYQSETGLPGPYRDPEKRDPTQLVYASRWDDWRRDKVTELVASIREAALAERPGLILSAAVISYADRAYLTLFQDWRRWIEDGLIELAIPMVYTLDDRLLRYQLESFGQGQNVWNGLGVWLFAKRPERALRQLEIARAAGSAGEVLFSYDAIADAPELARALRRVPAAAESAPTTP
jgi:uncharacterized lipoprotein YddW (UPF0748 family)